jgi:hypothetical protein
MRIIVQPYAAGVRQFEQRISARGDPPSAIHSGGMHAVEVRNMLLAMQTQTHLCQLFRRCGHTLLKKYSKTLIRVLYINILIFLNESL